MSVNVYEFFQCTQNKARKLFPIIRDHCSGVEKAELSEHLNYLVNILFLWECHIDEKIL